MVKSLIIEIQGHDPYYLRRGSTLTIGRSNKNDIVLKDPTVSRKHAVLRWDGTYPLIADLKSTAGTVVDNDYVSYRHLQGLHRIKIGVSYLRVEFTSEEQLDDDSHGLISDLEDSDEVTLFGDEGSHNIYGYLADTQAIHALLVSLETSRRTGTLTITQGSIAVKIVFGLGKIRGVNCGKLEGCHALQHACTLSYGAYSFSTTFDVGERHLKISPMAYLSELNKNITRRRPRYLQKETPLENSLEED